MSDPFATYTTSLESPASHAFDIVPNDSADLATATRALTATGEGAVRITTVGGETVSIFVAAGAPFPVRVRKVFATGTTATGLVGLY